MKFRCGHCQLAVGVTDVNWRVNVIGRASAGGPCEHCGNDVLRRNSKLSEAPADIVAVAVAVDAAYRHWRKSRTEERAQELRTLAAMFSRDRDLEGKLSIAFNLSTRYIRLLIKNG